MNEITKAQTRPRMDESKLPMGWQILFNDDLRQTVRALAKDMSNAHGVTPKHLIGCPEACYAVITRALTWKLDPYAVACSTYQTPAGQIGYEGKLVQAILEASGQVEGHVEFELYGDWDKIRGKFKQEKRKSDRGKEYAVPVAAWAEEDEKGVGVRVSMQVVGEAEPRVLDFDLVTAQPRNSTLWAIRPDQQIKYTAVRAFANTVAPSIFMGIAFDFEIAPSDQMKDVTPTKPEAPSPHERGRQARLAGQPMKAAPRELSGKAYDQWVDGWKEADQAAVEDVDEPADESGLAMDFDPETFVSDLEERLAAVETNEERNEIWDGEIEPVHAKLPGVLQERVDAAFEAASERLINGGNDAKG